MPYMSGNNYVDLFVTLSPDEMIAKFKATAPPRVQDAMQRTVLRCIGSMRDFLVEDSHKTTGTPPFFQRKMAWVDEACVLSRARSGKWIRPLMSPSPDPLPFCLLSLPAGVLFANLLYKAQVTGYMLFNAEQQVALTLSPFAADLAKPQPQHLLPTGEELEGQAQDEAVGMAMTGMVRVTQPVRPSTLFLWEDCRGGSRAEVLWGRGQGGRGRGQRAVRGEMGRAPLFGRGKGGVIGWMVRENGRVPLYACLSIGLGRCSGFCV